MRGWRVGVRASRSADSTSAGLSYVSAIAQTRERNYFGPSGVRGTVKGKHIAGHTLDLLPDSMSTSRRLRDKEKIQSGDYT